jgi:hypothetical protein
MTLPPAQPGDRTMSETRKPETPILDEILTELRSRRFFNAHRRGVDGTAELAALRSKLADAELMLRAALVGDLVDRPAPSEDATVRLYAPDPATFGGRGLRTIYLKADDRGIPILTPAARAALRHEG